MKKKRIDKRARKKKKKTRTNEVQSNLSSHKYLNPCKRPARKGIPLIIHRQISVTWAIDNCSWRSMFS